MPRLLFTSRTSLVSRYGSPQETIDNSHTSCLTVPVGRPVLRLTSDVGEVIGFDLPDVSASTEFPLAT
ncbi:hypothetical protein AN958_00785 [Leucoagaricus sp. SymC.cos]|nr:hypothetical protein AN958_00785 [Leucoagaricus sp. SymC.cos]